VAADIQTLCQLAPLLEVVQLQYNRVLQQYGHGEEERNDAHRRNQRDLVTLRERAVHDEIINGYCQGDGDGKAETLTWTPGF
jgi:hypothetical protein